MSKRINTASAITPNYGYSDLEMCYVKLATVLNRQLKTSKNE